MLRSVVAAHWPLLLALSLVGVAGIPTLNFAYGPDQALFAYIGRALARGQTLYVDVWDVKPPGVFWVYAVAAQAPGGFRGIRAFDLAYTLLNAAAVYALGRLLWSRGVGAIAAGLFGLVYLTASGYWNLAQPDNFMVLPIVLGVLAWERQGPGRAMQGALLAGVLFGVAFQFRATVALLPLALVVRAIWAGPNRAAALRRGGALVAGAALVQVATLGWLASGGALGEYLYAQLRFARGYARLGGPYAYDAFTLNNYLSGLRGSVMWFGASRLLLTAPALAAVLVGGVIRADRSVRLVALLGLMAVIGVAAQAKFFVYHWHPLLPFLALLCSWTTREVWRALRARATPLRAGFAVAGAGLTLLLFTPQVTDSAVIDWSGAVRYLGDPAFRHAYFDRFGLRGHGTYSFMASLEVADYVRARTEPGDTTFVWGYDPNFYLASERDSASRFLSFLPLMPTFTPEAWRAEFVADLARRRPRYILLQRGENARWISGRPDDSAEWVERFPAFRDLLARDYVFDLRIEDYSLYRLR